MPGGSPCCRDVKRAAIDRQRAVDRSQIEFDQLPVKERVTGSNVTPVNLQASPLRFGQQQRGFSQVTDTEATTLSGSLRHFNPDPVSLHAITDHGSLH
jgi:hypothetical protein